VSLLELIAAMQPEVLSYIVTAVFMIWLSVTDGLRHKLPNRIILAWILCRAFLISMIVYVEGSAIVIIQSLFGALVMGVAFFVIYILSKKALGAGDVKYAFAMGFSLLLNHAFWAAVCGFIICALYAVLRLIFDRANAKNPLPLGPFLFLGSVCTYWLT
jgi:prepilin signal peptidase PulO-like enzyme (type II secretory pathway)